MMKAMIKVGRWANEHKHAAAVILNKGTYYLDAEDTYQGIKHVDLVPTLSPYNLEALQINKDFMLSHGYIENDFDVFEWAAPEFLEKAAAELATEEWETRSAARLPKASSLEDAMTARLG
jgi:ABC-type nitrate/sulfonate/bicarbonate transport system substrate-binding protein